MFGCRHPAGPRRRPRRKAPATRTAVGLLICAGLPAACGGHSPSRSPTTTSGSPTSAQTTTAATSAGRPRRRRVRRTGAPLGATRVVHAGGSRLLVTVGPVLDPLSGSAALPPGMRAVGVVIAIRNAGGATYDSTASGDVSLGTSAGPAAPLFLRSGRCATPLTDFESLIGAGETRHGCVGFSVPRHARVTGVRFSPHSRAPGSVAWR